MPKRIVLCLDGTWNREDQAYPTNVAKLARAVLPVAPDGMTQVVFYDQGVGTGNFLDRVTGGAFGGGLDTNISDAYHFLMHNLAEGDSVYIFGFSRGAYTARSLGGLTRKCGVLHKQHAAQFEKAYQLYRSHTVGPDDAEAVAFRDSFSRETDIWCLGIWDTVGSLGVPGGLFRGLRQKKYGFHDVELSKRVKHGYHALSIDERRGPFKPTLWQNLKNPGYEKAGQTVEQVWFPGAHTDVGGGGYEDTGLSDIALAWMLGKANDCGLEFDLNYLPKMTRPDPFGGIHDQAPKFYKVLGSYQRKLGTVGLYESLSPSVLDRWNNASVNYRPKNLAAYLQEQESAKQ